MWFFNNTEYTVVVELWIKNGIQDIIVLTNEKIYIQEKVFNLHNMLVNEYFCFRKKWDDLFGNSDYPPYIATVNSNNQRLTKCINHFKITFDNDACKLHLS